MKECANFWSAPAEKRFTLKGKNLLPIGRETNIFDRVSSFESVSIYRKPLSLLAVNETLGGLN